MKQAKKTDSLSPRQLAGVANLFKMLGEPMRLQILQEVCREPRCVSDIVSAAHCTQANVSKHLSLLTAAGILKRAKQGQRVYYVVEDQLTLQLCHLVHKKLAGRTRRRKTAE